MIIIDAHLDLAYNAVNHGRNLRQSVSEIRAAENGRNPEGIATVAIPDLLAGGVGVVFGTLFVTPASRRDIAGEPIYHNAQQAHTLAMAQIDYYHRLADEDERVRLVGNRAALAAVLQSHEQGERPSLGIVPLMEGADPIREPEEAELWYERGLRLIGLAWDDTRYADGAWRG
ncbi:MAG: membrane dipeptidase, partial [Anaerolineae bacterium]